MEGRFNLAVYIGRFSPIHRAHLEIMQQALNIADRLLVVVGSRSKERRTYKNPWTSDERKEMIVRSLEKSGAVMHRVHIVSVFDAPGDDAAWYEQVNESIDGVIDRYIVNPLDGDEPEPKVTLIGHVKDSSSFYLQSFPRLVYSPAAVSKELRGLNATDIRVSMLLGTPDWQALVPEGAREFLQDWLRTHELPKES